MTPLRFIDNRFHKVKYLIIFLAGALIFTASAEETINLVQTNILNVEARALPVPESASDVAQKFIADRSVLDVSQKRQSALETEAELIDLIKKAGAARAKRSLYWAEKLSINVEVDEISGVVVRYVTPAVIDEQHRDHLFIHVHGGGYLYGAGDAGIAEALLIADRIKIPVISIDYRMPPKHPFPAAVDGSIRTC